MEFSFRFPRQSVSPGAISKYTIPEFTVFVSFPKISTRWYSSQGVCCSSDEKTVSVIIRGENVITLLLVLTLNNSISENKFIFVPGAVIK